MSPSTRRYNLVPFSRMEMEAMVTMSRGRQELSRHTHTLTNFSIDGKLYDDNQDPLHTATLCAVSTYIYLFVGLTYQ